MANLIAAWAAEPNQWINDKADGRHQVVGWAAFSDAVRPIVWTPEGPMPLVMTGTGWTLGKRLL